MKFKAGDIVQCIEASDLGPVGPDCIVGNVFQVISFNDEPAGLVFYCHPYTVEKYYLPSAKCSRFRRIMKRNQRAE
jgi:hypothetical protein